MEKNNLKIERLHQTPDAGIYRKKIKGLGKYNWNIVYKYSDLFISCSKNLLVVIIQSLKEFYSIIEEVIEKYPVFEKSLMPIAQEEVFSEIINEMIQKTKKFNVGPMASVAGALCDYIGRDLSNKCKTLLIENGGDIFIKTNRDITVGIYIENKKYSDKINLKLRGSQAPYGLCSSSGIFGHSLSLGKSDLVTVIGKTAIDADAAATSIGNHIGKETDISKAINMFKGKPGLLGILIVKGNKIGAWGNIELTS